MKAGQQRRLRAAVAAAGLALLAACTASQPPASPTGETAARNCFHPRQISGYEAMNEDTVFVNVGANQVYRLEVLGSCPHIDRSQQIAIQSTAGSPWVCQGLDAELLVPTPIGLQRCPVKKLSRLSDEERRAYRAGTGAQSVQEGRR